MSDVAEEPRPFEAPDAEPEPSLDEPGSTDFPVMLAPDEESGATLPAFDSSPRAKRSGRTHTVCLLGSTAAGKTCFLAGLAVLGEPDRASGLQVHAAAATKRRLNELGATLARGEWPAATNQTELLQLAVLRRGRIVDLVVVDYPGGDFERGVGALDAELAPVLDAHFREADALLLLFDPLLDVLPQEGEDHALREQRVRRQDAFLQAVRERAIERIRAGRPTPEVACVLTKADRWTELVDSRSARKFVEKHAPHLMQKLRTLGYRVAFFPVSSVGETAFELLDGREYEVPATPVAPRGYEELFDWIVARRAAKTPWSRAAVTLFRATLALAAVALVALGVPWIHDQRETQRSFVALDDASRPDGDRIRGSRPEIWLFPPGDELAERRSRFIEGRLDAIAGRIASAAGDSDLRESIGRLEELKKAEIGSHRGRLDELKILAALRIERNYFDRVAEAYRHRSATFTEAANEYLETYSTGAHSAEVRKMLEDERAARRLAMRKKIQNMPVETGFQLEAKADAIDAYLKSWPQEPEAERQSLARAAALARQFATAREYTVRLKKTGRLKSPYKHQLTFWVNEHEVFRTSSSQSATEVNWWGEEFRLKWKVGDPVDLSLAVDGFTDVPVARLRGSDLYGLFALSGRHVLQPYGAGAGYARDAYVELEVDGLGAGDWKIVADYLSPGRRW